MKLKKLIYILENLFLGKKSKIRNDRFLSNLKNMQKCKNKKEQIYKIFLIILEDA
jgi:hypothetical protein